MIEKICLDNIFKFFLNKLSKKKSICIYKFNYEYNEHILMFNKSSSNWDLVAYLFCNICYILC